MSVMVDDQAQGLQLLHGEARLPRQARHPARRSSLADGGVEGGAGGHRASSRAERAPGRRAVQVRVGEGRHSRSVSFMVDDLDAEFERLRALGVEFTVKPMDAGPVRMAILDDTCGNLVQLVEMKAK